jgi:hypothetical protein
MRVRRVHCGPYESTFTSVCAEPIYENDVPATIYKKVDNYILAEVMPILERDFDSPFDVYQA